MFSSDELTWPQFRTLNNIRKLSLNEQVQHYNRYINDLSTQRALIQLGIGSGGNFPTQSNPLPSECIEFVVNTTDGIFFEFTITSNVQDFSYTINWGDGVTEEGSSVSLNAFLNHTYPEGIAEYTVRICFSDPSVINTINFPGFD